MPLGPQSSIYCNSSSPPRCARQMELTPTEQAQLNGAHGPSLQWAMAFHEALGKAFGAQRMVPVASAHFGPDSRMMGVPGQELLDRLVLEGARIRVPGYTDPCAVDFSRLSDYAAQFNVPDEFVEAERRCLNATIALGFLPTVTCINFQTVTPPRFGEHLAWGDTGAAACANGIFGARTNFEAGASGLAAGLTGSVPEYGLHLDENRRGNLRVRIEAAPDELSDWGAIAMLVGEHAPGYETVPVLYGNFPTPSFNMLKQLGVALASYGSQAMFHLVGATPEAQTLRAAFHGTAPAEDDLVITDESLETVYQTNHQDLDEVDLVVFAAPQLSIDEVGSVVHELGNRTVNDNTQLLLAVGPQVKTEADRGGLTEKLERAGGQFITGVCFYSEAPVLKPLNGWRNVVTNSAKLVNTLRPTGLALVLARLEVCVQAAVTGRLQP